MWFRIFVVLHCISTLSYAAAYKRVCYYTNWAQYRPKPMTYKPDDVDPNLCTHLIFAFAKVENNTIKPIEWNDQAMYPKIVALKQKNPDLKVLLAVGGWTHGTASFTSMVSTDNNINQFCSQTLTYLRQNAFDGLDLDWEYPGSRDSPARDKQRFTVLVKKLWETFRADNKSPALLLTAAVGAGKGTIEAGYEIQEIAKYLDFINLMSYDYHASTKTVTAHHSPMYGRTQESGQDVYLNTNYSVNYWLSGGTPKEKLILGLAFYGRSFQLYDLSHTGLGAKTSGPGQPQTYTREAGFMAYYEICKVLENGWTRVWNGEHKVPYSFGSGKWVGYDDEESLRVKVEYIINKGLGGAMIWALDLDDFTNTCGDGKYPMMNLIKNIFENVTTKHSTVLPTGTTSARSTITSHFATSTSSSLTSETAMSSTQGSGGHLTSSEGETSMYSQPVTTVGNCGAGCISSGLSSVKTTGYNCVWIISSFVVVLMQ